MSLSPSTVAPSQPLAPRLLVALLAAFALVLGPLAFMPASAAPGDLATISGTVTLSPEGGLDNILVTLERRTDRDGEIDWEYKNSDYFNDGAYAFADVAPGTYRVTSGGPSLEDGSTPYAVQESAPFTLDGTDVTVPALNLTLGASIGGTTTVDGGGALDGVRVIASRLELGRYRYEREATSDSDGRYSVSGLRDGTYQLDFSKDDFLAEYYDNVPVEDGATGITTITIENGEVDTDTDKDAALTPAAIVSGQVTHDGAPLKNIAVSAYRKVVEDGVTRWETFQRYAFTDEDGNYRINDLPAGSYRIGFDDQDGLYAFEAFDDQPSVYSTGVTTFAMDAGDTEVADAELAPAGSITGTITGPAGTTVAGCVEAYGLVDGQYDQQHSAEDILADDDGVYELKGLAAGTYKLKFSDCNGDLAPEFWKNKPTFATGDVVTVVAEETTENIDAELAPRPTSARIEGVVTDTTSDGAKLSGIAVLVEQKFTTDSGDSWYKVEDDTTDSNGAYGVEVDDEGTYRVKFTDEQGLHFTEFNDNAATADEAPAIDVELGDVEQVDAALAPASAITGTLTRPLGDVCPTAYSVDDTDQSDPYFGDADYEAATYRIGELPAGEYKVRFDCGPQFGGADVVADANANPNAKVRTAAASATQNWYLGKTSFADANRVEGTLGEATPLQPVTVAPAVVPPVVNPPVVGPPAPTAPVAKKSASVKISAKGAKKKATLTVTVKAAGVTPTGKITIKLGSKTLKTVTLKNGKAKITLTKQKKGKRAYKVIYSGDSNVNGKSASSGKVKIK